MKRGDKIEAVLFDMDGVILDTERIHADGWLHSFQSFGIQADEQFLISLRGTNRRTQEAIVSERFGERVNYAELRERRRIYCERRFAEDGIRLKPGYRELTEWLKAQGIPRALCTSTEMEAVLREFPLAGISFDFDAAVTGTEPERGKPAPDVFLLGAEKLSADPANCFVLEDSPNGVESGFAAGCRVIMIPDTVPPSPELRKKTVAVCAGLLEVRELMIEIQGHS